MPTDDERREVAARLRDMAPGSDWPEYVAEACGMDVSKMSNHFHTYTAQLCQCLAELIEPEPERTCSVEEHAGSRGGQWVWFYNFSCGHAFESYWCMHPRYCPFCGAKAVACAKLGGYRSSDTR